MNYDIQDINSNALYVLKVDEQGTFYTDFVEIDKQLLEKVDLEGFYKTIYEPPLNSTINGQYLHNRREVAVMEFYQKIYNNYRELFGLRNYCPGFALNGTSDFKFQGKTSLNYIRVLPYDVDSNSILMQKGEGVFQVHWADVKHYTDEFFESFFIEQAYKSCIEDTFIKAYSHRRVGFTTYQFTLNDILSVEVSTNFCYGSAVYFVVTLIYDGIKIIPYSRLVLYYFANTIQLIRHTREYNVDDGSWKMAFDFVRDACNELKFKGSESFIANYVISECQKLTELLPSYLITNKFKLSERNDGSIYYLQDNFKEITLDGYKLVLFRGEKVAGSVDFTDSIKKLNKILPTQKYLDCIYNCCVKIQPELEGAILELDEYLSNKKMQYQQEITISNCIKAELDDVCKITNELDGIEIEVRKKIYEEKKLLEGANSIVSQKIKELSDKEMLDKYPDYVIKKEEKKVLTEKRSKQLKLCSEINNDISKHTVIFNNITIFFEKISNHIISIDTSQV